MATTAPAGWHLDISQFQSRNRDASNGHNTSNIVQASTFTEFQSRNRDASNGHRGMGYI